MQFLYPIGLLALAGIIIPLIIHLWNIRQGKTLKIGSIALLGARAHASSKSLKINDWLLLALRCLLLLLVALILAQPFLKKMASEKNKGWILVGKPDFPNVFKDNRKSLDSLIKQGYEIHDFNAGFRAISLRDTLNADTAKANTLNYTSLLTQLNDIIPSGANVYLFADERLNKAGHKLPEISYKLIWKILNQSDTLSNWITDYAGKKYEAKSDPLSTTYAAVNHEPTTIKIAIFESGNSDEKYLVAALNAIGSFSGRKIEINPAGKVDIGFWLSEKPVSATFKSSIDTNGTLFQYEKGKVMNETSFLKIDGSGIKLARRMVAPESTNATWTDGFGHPILTSEKQNGLNIFHFYSRFNPQWSELVWSELFVEALMPIVIFDDRAGEFGFENNVADQRKTAVGQKQFIQSHQSAGMIKTDQKESLTNIIWIIALITLLVERILSFRKKTVRYA